MAVTALDYDRNPNNGTQPGYLWQPRLKVLHSARETLQNLYGELENISLEEYKGAKIISYARQNQTA